MNAIYFGTALVDTKRLMDEQLRGAITTGITPEPDGRTMPATSSEFAGAIQSRGSFLSRALRFPAKIGARPKVASSSLS